MICNLQHLEHTVDLESTTNLRHAIKKLPTSDLVRWQQYIVSRRNYRPNLIICDWLKPIVEAYELLEDNDNQQLQTFTTQTINSKRINKSINNLPSRWTTPNFQKPNFYPTEPGRWTDDYKKQWSVLTA